MKICDEYWNCPGGSFVETSSSTQDNTLDLSLENQAGSNCMTAILSPAACFALGTELLRHAYTNGINNIRLACNNPINSARKSCENCDGPFDPAGTGEGPVYMDGMILCKGCAIVHLNV
jgi:hypothetical protein